MQEAANSGYINVESGGGEVVSTFHYVFVYI